MDETGTKLSDLDALLIFEAFDDLQRRLEIIGQISEFCGMTGADVEEVTIKAKSTEKSVTDDSNVVSDEFLYTVKELNQAEKLLRDRKRLEAVLKNVTEEIQDSQSYSKLVDFVTTYNKECGNLESFRKQVAKEQEIIEKLQKKMANAKEEMQNEVEDMGTNLQKSHFDLQMTKTTTSMERRYTKEFMDNKVDQVAKKSSKEIEEMNMLNKRLECRIMQEGAADNAISDFWTDTENELYEILDKHKFKFYDDQRKLERELRLLNKYKDLNLEKLAYVTEKLEACENVLETDKLEKQAELDRQEELRILNKLATLIEAWWRGVMVRKKLGPYAPPKKEKKKGKKGKKGKKK